MPNYFQQRADEGWPDLTPPPAPTAPERDPYAGTPVEVLFPDQAERAMQFLEYMGGDAGYPGAESVTPDPSTPFALGYRLGLVYPTSGADPTDCSPADKVMQIKTPDPAGYLVSQRNSYAFLCTDGQVRTGAGRSIPPLAYRISLSLPPVLNANGNGYTLTPATFTAVLEHHARQRH